MTNFCSAFGSDLVFLIVICAKDVNIGYWEKIIMYLYIVFLCTYNFTLVVCHRFASVFGINATYRKYNVVFAFESNTQSCLQSFSLKISLILSLIYLKFLIIKKKILHYFCVIQWYFFSFFELSYDIPLSVIVNWHIPLTKNRFFVYEKMFNMFCIKLLWIYFG